MSEEAPLLAFLTEWVESWTALSGSEQLTLIGASLMALFVFFPWLESSREGALVGLFSLGFFTLPGSVALVWPAFASKHRRPSGPSLGYWFVQLGVAIGCALVTAGTLGFGVVDFVRAKVELSMETRNYWWPTLGSFGSLTGALLALEGVRRAFPHANRRRSRRPRYRSPA